MHLGTASLVAWMLALGENLLTSSKRYLKLINMQKHTSIVVINRVNAHWGGSPGTCLR